MSELSDYKDAYSLLEEEYERKLAKLRDENMRTGIDNEAEYENIRSNYIIERTVLESNRLINNNK